MTGVTPGRPPDRDECIEQAYFFRTFRERLVENLPAQDVLARMHEELLTTTRLPYAVQFLYSELKHSGLLSSGFARLPHYFTPFQAFTVRQAEEEKQRFTMGTALLVLEREATYKAGELTPGGLFVYQFEAIARNRLGYDEGLEAVGSDPFYRAIVATDFLAAYEAVIPEDRHASAGKEAGLTAHVERFFCTLRQRCARFVRKTLSFSKCWENHVGALWYFIRLYNKRRL